MKKSLLLFLATAVLSLFAFDAAFTAYENRFLIHEYVGMEAYPLLQMGFNDRNIYLRTKPADTFRILSFGSSFTFGVTRPEYAFGAFLRRDLEKLAPQRPVEVVNLGVPGADCVDLANQFDFWSRNMDYDAAIFTIYPGANFQGRPKGVSRRLTYGPGVFVPSKSLVRMFDYLNAMSRALSLGSREKDPIYFSAFPFPEPVFLELMVTASKPYQQNGYQEFDAGLAGLARLLDLAARIARDGKRVLFVLAPPQALVSPELLRTVAEKQGLDAAQIDPALPEAVVRAMAEKAGLADDVLDLTPCLAARERQGEESLYYKTDIHWSARGNAEVGSILADYVAARWWGLDVAERGGCAWLGRDPERERFAREAARRVREKYAASGAEALAATP